MTDQAPKILHCRSQADMPPGFPAFSGNPSPGKLIAIGHALKRYDLIVTHGWGAINVAMAHKVFGDHLGLPPLIHHETGSPDFAAIEKRLKRKVIRRIALGSIHALVTPAPAIGEFATNHWGIPAARIAHHQPGIDLKRYKPTAKPDALPGLVKRSTEHWIGAEFTPDNIQATTQLVEALKELPRDWHLVLIAGETPTDSIRAAADAAEQSHRMHVLGASVDEAKALALCDIFVDLSGPYQHSRQSLAAMASATPVVEAGNGNLVDQLDRLIEDSEGRKKMADANRKRALAEFGVSSSSKALEAIYQAGIDR